MEWSSEAEDAVKKVPFFVRRRVRDRIEREAREAGKTRITPADVASTQARYLAGMSAEVQGYRIETCFGASGCPNRAVLSEQLFGRLERVLKKEDLLGFLKERVAGDLKFHHEFRVTLADCPNACSQPQIRDVGIIGACVPELTAAECRLCGICTDTCREKAIALDPERRGPRIAIETCINCGQCLPVCPTGTIADGWRGYRVQLGGRLGRHPRLARELPGIFKEDQVLEILQDALKLYKARSVDGERFAHLFGEEDFRTFCRRFCGANE
jgi:dissimilatory sulfite reductase (desulfoviridin) alpha/beta subunit